MSTNLRALPGSSLDIPGVLRDVADSIEEGTFGEVIGCAIALDADKIRVMWGGLGERGPCAHLLLTLGAQRITSEVLEAKR